MAGMAQEIVMADETIQQQNTRFKELDNLSSKEHFQKEEQKN